VCNIHGAKRLIGCAKENTLEFGTCIEMKVTKNGRQRGETWCEQVDLG